MGGSIISSITRAVEQTVNEVSRTSDRVGDAADDAFDDVVDAAREAANDVVSAVADYASFVVDSVLTVTGIDYIDQRLTGGLISNTLNGIIDTIENFHHGMINGEWVQIRNAMMGIVTTVVALLAIVIGALLMAVPGSQVAGGFLIAAGVVMLDAQYNQGELLSRGIAICAKVEEATTGGHFIETYAVEIQLAITVAAYIYAASYAIPAIGNITGITQALAQWSTVINIIQAGYGSYQTYQAVELIMQSQAYYREQLRQYEEYLNRKLAQQRSASEQWFNMMTNPDMIHRMQAGGDLYRFDAGHELFSVTDVSEPRFALALVDNSDPEMDRMMNNRYYSQYAGSDGFKI